MSYFRKNFPKVRYDTLGDGNRKTMIDITRALRMTYKAFIMSGPRHNQSWTSMCQKNIKVVHYSLPRPQ